MKSIVMERYIVKFDYNKLPAACPGRHRGHYRHTHAGSHFPIDNIWIVL